MNSKDYLSKLKCFNYLKVMNCPTPIDMASKFLNFSLKSLPHFCSFYPNKIIIIKKSVHRQMNIEHRYDALLQDMISLMQEALYRYITSSYFFWTQGKLISINFGISSKTFTKDSSNWRSSSIKRVISLLEILVNWLNCLFSLKIVAKLVHNRN